MEHIVEEKICRICNSTFSITDKDMTFYQKVSPLIAGKKYLIPAPTLCPTCRAQRRLLFRNERSLYHSVCHITGKPVISMYNPSAGYKTCDRDVWWSDACDSTIYARDMDFSVSFFENMGALWKEVPHIALYNTLVENSSYANHSLNSKHCYGMYGSYENEYCMYSNGLGFSTHAVDVLRGMHLTACYACIDCKHGYKLFRSQKCIDCSESSYLYNCTNCHHCRGCINLVNASYCIENIQYDKETYEKKITETQGRSYEAIRTYYTAFREKIHKAVHRYADLVSCEEVTGDNLTNAYRSYECFDAMDISDCKFCTHAVQMHDVYDAYGAGAQAHLMYEIVDTGLNQSKVAFTIVVYGSSNMYYCVNCHNCQDCFGCIGLRNKQYCILNKQYTPEAYEALVPKIIEHMIGGTERGEYFDPSLSPFSYQETIAVDYYPLKKEEALSKGYTWKERAQETKIPTSMALVQASELYVYEGYLGEEQGTGVINADILTKALICKISGKPFRLTKQELDFYQHHLLPLPRCHPDIRHTQRIACTNPKQLWERQCMQCGEEIITSYSPNREERVYCAHCFNQEVY